VWASRSEIDVLALDRWHKEKVIARTQARASELMVRETRSLLAGKGLYQAKHHLKDHLKENRPVRRFPRNPSSAPSSDELVPR
jgi:hypothetical protein